MQFTRANVTRAAKAKLSGKLTQKRVARLDRNWRGQLHHGTELLITEADCVSIHVKESVEPQRPAPRRAGNGWSSSRIAVTNPSAAIMPNRS
jgi:hypothetical protein